MRREINIDIEKFIYQLLPSLLRKEKMLLFLNCLLKPVKNIFLEFIEFRKDWYLEANTTGQTISLENYLNIKLGYTDKIIIITHFDRLDWFISLEKEKLGTSYLNKNIEGTSIVNLVLEDDVKNINKDFLVIIKDKNLDHKKVDELIRKFNIGNFTYEVLYQI